MELRTVFEEARDLAARLYVLAAPLHNDSLPGALSDRPDHVVCLMDGGADVQAVSPHLVHIPFDHFEAAREWLEQHGPASPCAMVIASPLSLAEFEAHLKPLLRIRLPDDTPIVLACWDPSILATLAGSSEDDDLFVKGPVLSEAQRQTFFAPVLRWWYWDRHGRLRQIDWRQDEVLAESVALRPPFRLEQAQVDDLIEASVPDNLLLHLNERDSSTFAAIPERERYGFVCRQIERARRFGIEGLGVQVEYCALAARHGEVFDESPEGAVLLRRLMAATSDGRQT